MNYGFQNEHDFVELFNNKYLHELDYHYKLFFSKTFSINKSILKTLVLNVEKTILYIKNQFKNLKDI